MRRKAIRRGTLFYADLDPVVGSEQGGTRPVLVLQNNVGNSFSPTVVTAAITSRRDKTNLPTHVSLGHMMLSPKDAYRLMLKDYPDVMDIGEMCKVLGISKKTGYKLLKDRKIESLKIGRAYRIPKAHILGYLKVSYSVIME